MRHYTRIKDQKELAKIKKSYEHYKKLIHKNLILGNTQTRRATFAEYKYFWVMEEELQQTKGTPKSRRHDNFARQIAAQQIKFSSKEMAKLQKRVERAKARGETTFTFEYEILGSDKKLHTVTKEIDITKTGRKLLRQFSVRDVIRMRIDNGEDRERVLADYGY